MGTTEKKEEEMIEGVILRLPRQDEHERLVRWRNENRQWFFKSEPITLTSHLEWYDSIRQDKNQTFYVIEAEGVPIGTISLALKGNGIAEYGRFLIAKMYRRKGYGSVALKILCKGAFERLGITQIYGEIWTYNKAAMTMVEGLGFKQTSCIKGITRMVIYDSDSHAE